MLQPNVGVNVGQSNHVAYAQSVSMTVEMPWACGICLWKYHLDNDDLFLANRYISSTLSQFFENSKVFFVMTATQVVHDCCAIILSHQPLIVILRSWKFVFFRTVGAWLLNSQNSPSLCFWDSHLTSYNQITNRLSKQWQEFRMLLLETDCECGRIFSASNDRSPVTCLRNAIIGSS